MSAWVLPQSLLLEESRPNQVPAVRKQMSHDTTTQQFYRPNENAYINIESGAAGTFMDTSCTLLEGTLVVANKNFYVDFFNTSRCGMHGLIDEFSVEINNTVVEINRFYAECIELDMIQKGVNRYPFEMTKSNPYVVGNGNAGDTHINFIKPSMVTNMGLPHNVKYPNLTSTTLNTVPDTILHGYLLNTNKYNQVFHGLASNKNLANSSNIYNPILMDNRITQSTPYSNWDGYSQRVSSFVPSTLGLGYYDDRIPKHSNLITVYEKNSTGAPVEKQVKLSVSDPEAADINETTEEAKENTIINPTSNPNDDKVEPPTKKSWTYSSVNENDEYWGKTTDPSDGLFSTEYSATMTNKFIDGTCFGYDKNINSKYRLVGLPLDNDVGVYSKCFPTSNTMKFGTFNVGFGESVNSSCPGQWPYNQPCDWEALQQIQKEESKLINQQNVVNYFANTKNIPCGIPLDLYSNTYGEREIWGDRVLPKSEPVGFSDSGALTEYQFSMKIYSSLIGEGSKKWFPLLVVAPGKLRVKIRFAPPHKFFQTLMDPNRRVPGTARDWIPYTGLVETRSYQYSYSTDGKSIASATPTDLRIDEYFTHGTCECIASGIHPTMISPWFPGAVYNSEVAMGKYPIPQMRLKEMHTVPVFGSLLTGIDPTDFGKTDLSGSAGNQSIGVSEFVSALAASITQNIGTSTTELPVLHPFLVALGLHSSYSSTELTNRIALIAPALMASYAKQSRINQEYGYTTYPESSAVYGGGVDAPERETIYKINEYSNYIIPSSWNHHKIAGAYSGNAEISFPVEVYKSDNSIDEAYDAPYKSQNWLPFCNPTPQYIPVFSPENKSSTRSIKNLPNEQFYCNENQICFGTHKLRSQAQVRRTHTSLYPLNIPDQVTSRINERLTYWVKNLRIITQEVILPMSASESIIAAAIQGGISIEGTMWKASDSLLPKSSSQRHLINIAAAFCTNITFLFRPLVTIQGDQAYGYSSLGSFMNPWTSFDFVFDPTLTPSATRSDDYNALGGRPVYQNALDWSNHIPINVQLKILNESYPRNPITSLHQLLQHTRWGDQVFSSTDYLMLDPKSQPSYKTNNSLTINTLQDGYFACHVPIYALDDQTITCNPYFNPLEMSLRRKIRGSRAPIDALQATKPFEGTFHLSFNLESLPALSSKMRTGIPIMNNNVYLCMDEAYGLNATEYQLLTIATCDCRIVFERGGLVAVYS